eukprot:jgi/Bigna1/81125/fgenesh1_pg.77_\
MRATAFDAFVLVSSSISLPVTLWKIYLKGAWSGTSGVKILWGTASLMFGAILFSILLPRGPTRGPWQLIQIMTGYFLGTMYVTIIYIIKNLTQTMYGTARMTAHLPRHLEVVFNGTIAYIIIASIAGTIAILITDEKRYEAIQFLACASMHLHITPYGFYTGYVLITNIHSHVSTLKSQSRTHEPQTQTRVDSTTELKLPLKGNSNSSALKTASSTRLVSPSYVKRNVGSSAVTTENINEVHAAPIEKSFKADVDENWLKNVNANLNRRLPTGGNLVWINKLSALNSRLIYTLIFFGTTSVIAFVMLLALGLQALNSSAKYSEENEKIYAESNWPNSITSQQTKQMERKKHVFPLEQLKRSWDKTSMLEWMLAVSFHTHHPTRNNIKSTRAIFDRCVVQFAVVVQLMAPVSTLPVAIAATLILLGFPAHGVWMRVPREATKMEDVNPFYLQFESSHNVTVPPLVPLGDDATEEAIAASRAMQDTFINEPTVLSKRNLMLSTNVNQEKLNSDSLTEGVESGSIDSTIVKPQNEQLQLFDVGAKQNIESEASVRETGIETKPHISESISEIEPWDYDTESPSMVAEVQRDQLDDPNTDFKQSSDDEGHNITNQQAAAIASQIPTTPLSAIQSENSNVEPTSGVTEFEEQESSEVTDPLRPVNSIVEEAVDLFETISRELGLKYMNEAEFLSSKPPKNEEEQRETNTTVLQEVESQPPKYYIKYFLLSIQNSGEEMLHSLLSNHSVVLTHKDSCFPTYSQLSDCVSAWNPTHTLPEDVNMHSNKSAELLDMLFWGPPGVPKAYLGFEWMINEIPMDREDDVAAYVESRDVKIVSFSRYNRLRHCYSIFEEYQRKSGKYSTDGWVIPEKFFDDCISWIAQQQQVREKFLNKIVDYRVLNVEFGELCSNTDVELARIEYFFGFKEKIDRAFLPKNDVPLSTLIKNWDSVYQHLLITHPDNTPTTIINQWANSAECFNRDSLEAQ